MNDKPVDHGLIKASALEHRTNTQPPATVYERNVLDLVEGYLDLAAQVESLATAMTQREHDTLDFCELFGVEAEELLRPAMQAALAKAKAYDALRMRLDEELGKPGEEYMRPLVLREELIRFIEESKPERMK